MDIKISNGRPFDLSNREQKEVLAYDLLGELNIEYVLADHEKADTMEICEEIDKVLDTKICKNLFLCNRQKTAFYLLLMPGDKPFKTKELSKQIGSARLSFADADAMERYLNITPGSVSVLGLMNDKENAVKLLIDKDLLEEEYFGCHPCVNTSSLKIKMADITEKFLPKVNHTYQVVELFGVE